MLQRTNGATISEIMQTMGWQKHKGVERAIDCVAGELGRRGCPQPRSCWNHACVWGPFQLSADGPRQIYYADLRSAFDLFDSDGSRVVASALGEFPAARRSPGSDEQSPYYVVDRSTYAASDCPVFT
jgi:hypothetical protein